MQLTSENFNKARDFILVNARMIERRLFHFYFEQGSAEGVYHALYAYRNEDGAGLRSTAELLHLHNSRVYIHGDSPSASENNTPTNV